MAETFTGRLGDWAVAGPHRSFLARHILRHGRAGGEEEDIDEVRIPEMRLLVGILGTVLLIVCRLVLRSCVLVCLFRRLD
jgi:hypothetical protein